MSHELMLSLQQRTLDNTIGAIYLGGIGASTLFGITTIQAYFYFHAYPNDAPLHKISVAALWLLECFHQALIIHAGYVYIITGFGNLLGLAQIIWSIKLQVAINVMIILIVHSLYAYRVWLLGGYHGGFLSYLITAIVAGGFGIGLVLSYKVYGLKTFFELDSISWAIIGSLATATMINFMIAVTMSFYLWKSRTKASETGLNSKISRVMQFTLGSGLLTSACSLSALFTYLLLPNTFIFVGIEFLLTQLYVGSFLAMLNAREREPVNSEESSIEGKRLSTVKFVTSSSSVVGSPVSRYKQMLQTHIRDLSASVSGGCSSTITPPPVPAMSRDGRPRDHYTWAPTRLRDRI